MNAKQQKPKQPVPQWRPVEGKPHLMQDPDGRWATRIDPNTKQPMPLPKGA